MFETLLSVISDQDISSQDSKDWTSAWVALDRLICELESGRQVVDRFSAALATIRDSTRAQFAFVYSDAANRVIEMIGDACLPSQWYRDITQKVAARIPRGGLWLADERDLKFDLNLSPIPAAVVLLPIEGPRPSWLVAVSLDPEHVLQDADFRIIQVIWRLQVGHHRHVRVYENLKETLFGIVRCLSSAIDAKDPYTCGHSERVARIAVRLAEEMNLSRGEAGDLYLAGLLHDVGKIGIRDEVLCKPGPLTPSEEEHVQQHPIIGDRIVSNVTRLAYLRPAVRGHHERFDGKGYPDGLFGRAIPLMARTLAVADACDAMMSARRYRPALAPSRIETIFREGSGTQWDPEIVKSFFECRQDLYSVCQRGLGQSVYMAVERAASGSSQLLVRANVEPNDSPN